MFLLANLALTLLAMALLAPALVLLTEVVAARMPKAPRADLSGRRPSVTVLVPAHNEAASIQDTVRNLLEQLRVGDGLLVVADNCSDATVELAREAGATVIERNDATRKGKGYAVDFGIRFLKKFPTEVVILVDADCLLSAGSVDALAITCLKTGRPAQALYLMQPPVDANARTRISAFAWIVKNHVRPLGLQTLGLPCHLMGSGMAFTWDAISGAALANGHLVEDLKLGLDMARAGLPATFCPQAIVTSFFPSTGVALSTQRTRWEHGHLGMIIDDAPVLIRKAVQSRDIGLFALALDLTVPPIALLLALAIATAAVTLIWSFLTKALLPLAVATIDVAVVITAVLLAWRQAGREVVTYGGLWRAGAYALWKIPLYLHFLSGKQIEWVRSARDGKSRH